MKNSKVLSVVYAVVLVAVGLVTVTGNTGCDTTGLCSTSRVL